MDAVQSLFDLIYKMCVVEPEVEMLTEKFQEIVREADEQRMSTIFDDDDDTSEELAAFISSFSTLLLDTENLLESVIWPS